MKNKSRAFVTAILFRHKPIGRSNNKKNITFKIPISQSLQQKTEPKAREIEQHNQSFKNQTYTGSKESNKYSLIKLQPLSNDPLVRSHTDKNVYDQQITKKENLKTQDGMSDITSLTRMFYHPVMNNIKSLFSQQTYKLIVPAKSFKQNAVGQASSIWICVVDSLFLTLQKIIKVKKIQTEIDKEKKEKNGSPPKQQKTGSPSKQQKAKKSPQKQAKNIKGIVQSNIKATIETSKIYSCLQNERKINERVCLAVYQDPNHYNLILQAVFYERAIMYLLGTIRKWNHEEELLYIHSLSLQIIPCILQCRKLMVQILIEALQSEQDAKIRKPKYIAKQKKLIQISKFVGLMKNQYPKYLNSLGSPNRYKNFQLPTNLKEYLTLTQLQEKWKNLVFDHPMPPFITENPNRKDYLLVIEPLNLLYKYNKKQQSLQIDSYAEEFLRVVGSKFDIVFFTYAYKQSSLLNFLGTLSKAQIIAILDRHHFSYSQAKPIKDVSKIGGGYNYKNILIVDQKTNQKYYSQCKQALMLVEGNKVDARLYKAHGKISKLSQIDQDYLKILASKILIGADNGGKWDNAHYDKIEKRH